MGSLGKGVSSECPGNRLEKDGSPYGGGNWSHWKLEMPDFERADPNGWFLRVEKFFSFYKLTETEKLEVVVVAIKGNALRWSRWENKRNHIDSWDWLKEFIPLNFGEPIVVHCTYNGSHLPYNDGVPPTLH